MSIPDSQAIPQPPVVRWVVDGNPEHPPAGATLEDNIDFATNGPGHLVTAFYLAPSTEQITALGRAWGLHLVTLEDLLTARQRPKVEHVGHTLFVVLRSAHYNDADEDVEFDEFHVVVRKNMVAVLCHGSRWVDGQPLTEFDLEHPIESVRRSGTLLSQVNLLTLGPEAVLYRVIDGIVAGYGPVLHGLELDREEIESQVFGGDAAVAERIYRLSREVIAVQQTVTSVAEVVDALKAGFDRYQIPRELQKYLDDVSDHLTRLVAHTRDLRDALAQILNVNATLVGQRQNEDMKKISAWAAILFAPTLIGAIYGMNFDRMPELHWVFGYPLALALMVVFSVGLYIAFKRSKWM